MSTAIRTRALTKALYGCEASPASAQPLGSLRTAISKALGSRTHHSSTCLTFDTHTTASDLDPVTEILSRRLLALHRL